MTVKTEKSQDFNLHRENIHTDNSVAGLQRSIVDNLLYYQGRFPSNATTTDWYLALAYAVRGRLLQQWLVSEHSYLVQESRTVCYFSAEFLIGPQMGNNLVNMGLYDHANKALEELGIPMNSLLEEEEEPGLGNGGLGRLAACYLDSLTTLRIPAIGYGIRYEFGIFNQSIVDGGQVEKTDKWLLNGNPWELHRHKIAFDVMLGGNTEVYHGSDGRQRIRWRPERVVKGVAYDMPIVGYHVKNANLLRLWKAEAPEAFDLNAFNTGDHLGAVTDKMKAENLSKILYPNDHFANGKRLRLQQQYFLVSCSLQDMIRIYLKTHDDLSLFHQKYATQLNDTHPALAIPELMRLLIDVYDMEWEEAWNITCQTFSFTNHTLLPEAIETWSLKMFGEILPRHLEIILEINRRFLDEVRVRYRGDEARVEKLSLIGETGGRHIRMANLACVGSHTINGVAELHTHLLKQGMFKYVNELWPGKIVNVTNGITPRRFLRLANPSLCGLLHETIGDEWANDLQQLHRLEALADDKALQRTWHKVKRKNKVHLAQMIYEREGISIDPDSLFDIQAKRFHEYKRQHLNILHVITLYNRIKDNPDLAMVPRTFIFSGKAAPAYTMAKLIIKLINSVAEVVNKDPVVRERIKVFFLPNFNVKNAMHLYPAADLSEQISTAGMEASGTGNMKFSLNGALTIGTLDGANIEIREAVGVDNFFLFGKTADELQQLQQDAYRPVQYYEQDEELRSTLDLIKSGVFSHGDQQLFQPLVDALLRDDPFRLMADYRSYVDCHSRVQSVYQQHEEWTRMAILNVARMGRFSSDRAVHEYCDKIWKVAPVAVEL